MSLSDGTAWAVIKQTSLPQLLGLDNQARLD